MFDDVLRKIKDKNDKLLLNKTLDKYNLHKRRRINTYTNFLNPRELTFLENYMKYLNIPYRTYKIFGHQEKSIIYFGEYANFISIFKIANSNIKHKDILGALYGIGYTNDMIGDIYITDNVYFTNLERYDNLLINSLDKVASYNISLEKIDYIPEIILNFEDVVLSANSLRIDLFISKLISLSRSQVIKFLSVKRVYINYLLLNNTSYNISENDIISIESVGKFIIDEIKYIEKTKKYKISCRKYR